MAGQGSKFATGKYSKSISDRDGMKYDYTEMVIEPDTKLMVHRDEVDEPDPYRRLRSRQDAIALRYPRPDTTLLPGYDWLVDADGNDIIDGNGEQIIVGVD